jgi:hypothetical protein
VRREWSVSGEGGLIVELVEEAKAWSGGNPSGRELVNVLSSSPEASAHRPCQCNRASCFLLVD